MDTPFVETLLVLADTLALFKTGRSFYLYLRVSLFYLRLVFVADG